MDKTDIIILTGGASSSEIEISLRSAENVYQRCSKLFRTEKIILDKDELPHDLLQRREAIFFPIWLGKFGEDGQLQKILEDHGLNFIGSDSLASALCMDKFLTKKALINAEVQTLDTIKFTKANMPPLTDIVDKFGENLVIKPNADGSSIDVHLISSLSELEQVADNLHAEVEYLVEKKIMGIDLTVGILDGKALEVVEILPKHGFLDYDNKYIAGKSHIICPANISSASEKKIKSFSEIAFKRCGCRDWARADFIKDHNDEIYFLELNTIPGMTQTSFYPRSAAAAGINLDSLIIKFVELAKSRICNPDIITVCEQVL